MVGLEDWYDDEARRLGALLPPGPRVVVIGSTDFWHDESARTCAAVGRRLAAIPHFVLLTGGMPGIGEAVARAFAEARRGAGHDPRVFHVLPEGDGPAAAGETLAAGTDMRERREVLGRLARLYLLVEGGPGAVHEAEVAAAHGATVLPLGRSGGHAAALYTRMARPPCVDAPTWATLGAEDSTPEETAAVLVRAVRTCLGLG